MQPIPGAVSRLSWMDWVFHGLCKKLVDVVYLVWPKIDLEDWLVIDLRFCVAVGGHIR